MTANKGGIMKDPVLKALNKKTDEHIENQFKNYFMNGFVRGVKAGKDNIKEPVDVYFLKKEFDLNEDKIIEFFPNKQK